MNKNIQNSGIIDHLKSCIGFCRSNRDFLIFRLYGPESKAVENESVNRLELELGQTSKKLDKTQAEMRKLHDQLGKINKIYGAASPAALHPGTNEANRQK